MVIYAKWPLFSNPLTCVGWYLMQSFTSNFLLLGVATIRVEVALFANTASISCVLIPDEIHYSVNDFDNELLSPH